LPVLGLEQVSMDNENPDNAGVIEQTVRFKSGNVRQCDSCYLAAKCQRFEEHADCAYKIPVEIRTKTQLRAAMNALIEMQFDRVTFAKFAEDLEGQGVDPSVSTEMDRFFRLLKEMKDVEDSRDLIRIDVEAKASSGVL